MKCSQIGFILLFLCFISCQNPSPKSNSNHGTLPDNIDLLFLLFFKREQKAELWGTNAENEFSLINTYQSVRCENTPIGIFHLNVEHIPLLVLESPNDFYGEKIGEDQFEEIFIVDKLGKNTNRQSIIMKESDLSTFQGFLQKDSNIRTFVFPNDLRKDGSFEACFGCPHRMAELYSSLELHINQFKETPR